MNKHVTAALLAALLGAGWPTASALAQPTQAAIDALPPAHVAALAEYLRKTHFTERAIHSLQTLTMSGAEQDARRSYLTEVTPDRAMAMAIPVLARYLNQKQATELARALQSTLMLRAQEFELRKATGKKVAPLMINAREQAEVKRYDSLEGSRILTTQRERIEKDLSEAWRDWMTAHMSRYENRLVAIVGRGLDTLENAAEQPQAPVIAIDKVGISFYDQMAAVVLNNAVKVDVAERRMRAAMVASGYMQLLDGANLVDKAGIERAKAIMADVDTKVGAHLLELEQLDKERVSGLRAIAMPGKSQFMANIEKTMADNHSFNLRFADSQRKILEVQRRMVQLAESRLGHIKLENGTLMFSSQQDLAMADAIDADLKQASLDNEAMVKTENERRRTQRQGG